MTSGRQLAKQTMLYRVQRYFNRNFHPTLLFFYIKWARMHTLVLVHCPECLTILDLNFHSKIVMTLGSRIYRFVETFILLIYLQFIQLCQP